MVEKNQDKNQYDDIINLPHHVSSKHKSMSIRDRAAQFSPFAAMTGHDLAIKETARLTDQRKELDENEKNILDEKLRIVKEQIKSNPEIEIVYFQPDEKKFGGSYVSIRGAVKKIDGYERVVVMQDGTRVQIEDIVEIMGEMFSELI